MSDYFPPEKRGRAMSMFSLGGVAGIGAGMLMGGIVGQAYGWRVALIAAGIPGLILALVMRLTVREPKRGASDNLTEAEESLGFFSSLKRLWQIRTFRWLVVGASLSMVTSIGRGAWEPVFLMRVYGLEQASAGITYFLISPLPSMVGAILGGIAADRLGRRDKRWYMWLPALATVLSFPLMVGFLLLPTDSLLLQALPVGFACSIMGSIIGAMSSPATIAAAQSMAPANLRATSHALWSMTANLVGMGIGPVLAGMLSESFAPTYGAESLRYALVIVSAIAVPAAIALVYGARTAGQDMAGG